METRTCRISRVRGWGVWARGRIEILKEMVSQASPKVSAWSQSPSYPFWFFLYVRGFDLNGSLLILGFYLEKSFIELPSLQNFPTWRQDNLAPQEEWNWSFHLECLKRGIIVEMWGKEEQGRRREIKHSPELTEKQEERNSLSLPHKDNSFMHLHSVPPWQSLTIHSLTCDHLDW